MRIPPVWVTFIGFALVHAAMALSIPLIEDETYYALWATGLSQGYYDHPPMVAWWIAAGEWIFGETRFGVRFVAVLSAALLTLMTARIGTLVCGNRRGGAIAALLMNATVLVLALGFSATPDAPSVFFWTAAVWAFVESRQKSPRWWLLVGLFTGLGILSKFTNLFFALALVVWLLASREGRAQLFQPLVRGWVLSGALLAMLVISPLIWWNYNNNWLGLERQFGRIGGGVFDAAGVLEFAATTVLLLSPLIFWFVLRGAWQGRNALLWLSAPLLLYMLRHSFTASVPGNWLLPLYPTFAVFAALALQQRSARLIWGSASLGLLSGVVALALIFWPGGLIPGNHPGNQVKGWPDTVAGVRALAEATGARWIASSGYGLTGSLAWYLPERAVWSPQQTKRYLFRGGFPQEFCNAPGLWLQRASRDGSVSAGRYFVEAGVATELVRRSGDTELMRYVAVPVRGVRGDAVPGFDCPS
jgi:4-amino-4-deoxy-L-arabinose transferase-like glycosyltransferase